MDIINNRSLPDDSNAVFSILKAQLNDTENGGRQKIIDAVTANMDAEGGIRERLKNLEDATFLASLIPDDMKTAQIAQGVRDFLHQNGFLQPIIGIFQSIFPFLDKMLRGFGLDGVADKLQGAIDINRLQQTGLTREANTAAGGTDNTAETDTPSGETVPEADPDPAADREEPATQPASVQPGQ